MDQELRVTSTSKLVSPEEFLPIALLCDTMAVDTETNGGDVRDGTGFCVGISVAVLYNNTYYSAYFPVAHHEDNVSEEIKQSLFQIIASRKRIVFHNAKFDLESLDTAGYIHGFIRWYDTMLMAHMLNENIPKGLDWLAKNELKEPGKVKKDFGPIWRMKMGHFIPVAEIELYAGTDTELTLKLFYRLYPYFVKSGFDGSEVQKV
jgi:hypothetical protein